MALTVRTAGPDLRLAKRFAANPVGWALGVFFARYLADALRDAWRGTDASLGHQANLGIFQLLAWGCVFYLVSRIRESTPSRAALIWPALISLTAVLRADNAAWVGMSALGAYVFFTFPRERTPRAAALVMLALATQLFWGRILFELVAFQIEVFDAKLAAGLLSLLHQSVTLNDNFIGTASHQIVIYEACTSFHNISIAILAWVTITKFIRLEWRASDLATAALLIVVTVAMNSLRLFLMASSAPGLLEYWHTGAGSQMINASLSALIAGICLWARFGAQGHEICRAGLRHDWPVRDRRGPGATRCAEPRGTASAHPGGDGKPRLCRVGARRYRQGGHGNLRSLRS